MRLVMGASLAWALLLLPLLHPDHLSTAPAGLRVTVVEAGIEVSLTVPGRTYPHNAVIRVVLRVRNVTHHPVELGDDCPTGPVRVEVRDATGTVVYPPAVPLLAQPTCPRPLHGGPRLGPGQMMEQRWYVLLRAAQLDAAAAVGPYNTQIVTPTVRLRLVAAPSPRIRLHTAGRISATILPATPVRGPLLVSQSYRCQSGLTESNIAAWHVTQGRQIRPGCAHVVVWYAVAGWLNHPVASITYGTYAHRPWVDEPLPARRDAALAMAGQVSWPSSKRSRTAFQMPSLRHLR